MKRIIILFLVLLSYLIGFGQAEQTRSSPTITVVDANAFVSRSFRPPSYADTVAANLVPQLDSAGKIIYTFNTNSIWFRQNNPHKWVPISTNKGTNGDTLFAQLPAFFDSVTRAPNTILKILRQNGIVTGGTVTVGSCRSLDVVPTTIVLNYLTYSSVETHLQVPASDPSLPRTDEVVDSLGTIVLKVGVPASPAIGRPINPSTEFLLGSYTLAAGATCLNITQIIVWDENLGTTAEFNLTTVGTITANGNDIANPFHLIKDIYVSSYTNGSSLIFTYSSLLTAQSNEILKFWAYSNGVFFNQFQIQLYNGSTPIGSPVAFNVGFGFNPNDSNQYQNVNIPFSALNITTQQFDKIVITFAGNDLSGAKGLYLDYIQLQQGNNNGSPNLTLTTIGSSGASTLNSLTNVLNIPVYSGGGGSQTLQQVFDAQNAALLNKNDTIKTQGNTLFILDSQNGALNYLLDSAASGGHGKVTNYVQTGKLISLGTQDNATAVASYTSAVTLNATKGALSLFSNGPVTGSLTGTTTMNFYPDSLKVLDHAGNRLFKINQTSSQISLSQAYGDGAVYDFTPLYGLGIDANGNVNAINPPALLSTNGTPNGDQLHLNLVQGSNVTLTDDGSGNVTIAGSGGSGSANSNIGSGFRLAVPNTNNIKTLFNGYAIGIDSASNTNALTLKADTSLLLTKLGAAALYTGNNGTVTTVTGTSPVIITSTPTATPNVTIQAMDATHAGYVIAGGSANKVLHGDGTWKDTTAAGAGNFINNQTTLQASSNFNISGNGDIGDSVRALFGKIGNYASISGVAKELFYVKDSSRYVTADGNISIYGIFDGPQVSKTSGADANGIFVAFGAEPSVGTSNTSNWTSTNGVIAVRGSIVSNAGSSGTVTNSSSFYSGGDMQGSVAFTNSNGLYVNNPFVSGATITNRYGIYVEGQTVGSTLNYDSYFAGTAPNFMGGALTDNISVTTPLDIGGTTTTSTKTIQSTSSGSHTTGADVIFQSGPTQTMIIQDNGNVGIGINPTATIRLSVAGVGNNEIGVRMVNTTAGTASGSFLTAVNDSTSANGNIVLEALSTVFTTSGMALASEGRVTSGTGLINGLAVYTNGPNNLKFGTNGIESFRVLGSNQHVLIGTTTDIAPLTVTGAASISTSVTSPIIYGSSSASGTLTLHGTSNGTAATSGPISSDNINIVGTTLSGSSTTSNFLNVTGTLAASTAATSFGVFFNVTSAGSSSQSQFGIRSVLGAGYTGNSPTEVLSFVNSAAGTGNDLKWASTETTPVCNAGVAGFSLSTTTGANVGTYSEAADGVLSVGIFGKSTFVKNSGTNIGIIGQANNTGTSPIQIGGYFTLGVAAPTYTSAALMADNAVTTSDIFDARDNGTIKFSIVDGGNPTLALGNKLVITEGSNGSVGQTTLVAGTKAITISGVTTSTRCFIQGVSQGGTVSTTFEYAAVCTSNTLTITALTTGNVTNTLDTSVLNYFIIN